ncbi:MAG: SUMF1/EgtB/PvdO family nonheme iron enzyme [Deltaproteobacteria bacterium]|nr:SUMF1/EgtB/PvdO family nonheme iron enzyme [Deltaproteobacteria bacterium]
MLDRTVGWLLGAACTALIVVLASTHRVVPRCPAGMEPLGARCCGLGQRLEAGLCVGAPRACGEGLERRTGSTEGCVAPRRRVPVGAGQSSWRPPDDTAGAGEIARTGAFAIDAYEVTWDAWARCVAAQRCPSLPAGDPGQAVSGVTRDEARLFCRFVGGRLPTDAEWLRAAIGDVERRYPWGDPDALCLRAAFALDGRCARGATGPDTAGARPWGKTPSGVHDLAGNVAEWVDDGAPAGDVAVRGGSFREHDAMALRPRWRRVVIDGSRHDWIGLRCVYDEATP